MAGEELAASVVMGAAGQYTQRGQDLATAKQIIGEISDKLDEVQRAIIDEIVFQNLEDAKAKVNGLIYNLKDYSTVPSRNFLDNTLLFSGQVLGELSGIVKHIERFKEAQKAYPLYISVGSIRSIIWQEFKYRYTQSDEDIISINNNIKDLNNEFITVTDDLIDKAGQITEDRFRGYIGQPIINPANGRRIAYFVSYKFDGDWPDYRTRISVPSSLQDDNPPPSFSDLPQWPYIRFTLEVAKEPHMQKILDSYDNVFFKPKEILFKTSKNIDSSLGSWTDGWTSIEHFKIGSKHYLFLNKDDGSKTAITEIRSDLNTHEVWSTDSWTPGWTSIMPFRIGTKHFVFIYKKDGSKTAIYEIDSNLTPHQIWVKPSPLPKGYTSFVPFKISGSGKLYFFANQILSGKVIIDKINSDGTNEGTSYANVWQDEWTKGWSSVKLFTMNESQYLILYKFFEGKVEIHKIESNGVGTSNVWEHEWTKGWSSILPFTYNQQPHLFLYKCYSGDVVISKINANGNGTTEIKRFKFSPGWTSIVPFELNGQTHIFMYKLNSGSREIMSISNII